MHCLKFWKLNGYSMTWFQPKLCEIFLLEGRWQSYSDFIREFIFQETWSKNADAFFKLIQLLIKGLCEIVMEQGAIDCIAWNSTCSSSRSQHICVHDIHRNIPWSGVVIFENPSGVKFCCPEILRSQRCFGKNKWLLYQFKFFQFNLILTLFFWCQILLGLWIMITTQSFRQLSGYHTEWFKEDINIFSSFAFLSTSVVIGMTCLSCWF